MCDCIAHLKAAALLEAENADKAARDVRTRIHEPLLRRRATALGWAAGELRRHQRTQEINDDPEPVSGWDDYPGDEEVPEV